MRRFNFCALVVFGMSLFAVPNQLFAQRTIPVDENGRSCITQVKGKSVEQQTQKSVWEHSVYATNRCNRTINLRVCYANTDNCSTLTVAAGQENHTLLGIKREERFQFGYDGER
jgi:hypothetical protein